MSEIPKYYSLSAILGRVKSILDEKVTGKNFWLKVEIANINFHNSGHVYLELAETRNNKIIAKCKGMIWGIRGSSIRASLGDNYRKVLSKGNEILCYVQVNYRIEYGLSINILDLSLEFAIGQIEKKRQETINRLTQEGALELNRENYLPVVIKKIALIASKNTSGYQDFTMNLLENQYKYVFEVELYSSSVQGDAAVADIVSNLKKADSKQYDCVVVIRGGGSKMDLDVFNSYEIAKQVSQMKNPVLSGIGHETDVTVLDFVVHTALKTPTEVSNFIINKTLEYEKSIVSCYDLIFERYQKLIERRTGELKLLSEGIINSSNSFTQLRRGSLHTIMNRLVSKVHSVLNEEQQNIMLAQQKILQLSKVNISDKEEALKKRLEMLVLLLNNVLNNKKTFLSNALVIAGSSSPKSILKKGFVIPRVNGMLYSGTELEKDSIIRLEFADAVVLTKYLKKE